MAEPFNLDFQINQLSLDDTQSKVTVRNVYAETKLKGQSFYLTLELIRKNRPVNFFQNFQNIIPIALMLKGTIHLFG